LRPQAAQRNVRFAVGRLTRVLGGRKTAHCAGRRDTHHQLFRVGNAHAFDRVMGNYFHGKRGFAFNPLDARPRNLDSLQRLLGRLLRRNGQDRRLLRYVFLSEHEICGRDHCNPKPNHPGHPSEPCHDFPNQRLHGRQPSRLTFIGRSSRRPLNGRTRA